MPNLALQLLRKVKLRGFLQSMIDLTQMVHLHMSQSLLYSLAQHQLWVSVNVM